MMSHIYFLMGKSASGKDELARKLLSDKDLNLKPVVLYTTRPKREGENDGREYHFIGEDERLKLKAEGKVIEERVYHTVMGDWYYMTVDDGSLENDSENDFFVINTLEAFVSYKEFFGEDRVIPLYIEVSPEIRMQRAIERERRQENPNMEEVKRRFLADEEDFSQDKLKEAGIRKRFSNDGKLSECFSNIKNEIMYCK